MMEVSISHLDPRLPSLQQHHQRHPAAAHCDDNDDPRNIDGSVQTAKATVDFHHSGRRSTLAGEPAAAATLAMASKEQNQPNYHGHRNNDNTTAAVDNREEGTETKAILSLSLQELIYATSSFHAIIKPVCITMILTALAVQYVNTPATKAAGEAQLAATYQVFTISEGQSAAKRLGYGLINSLIIVCAITAMTFLLVILYKYRCMKVLSGYMVIASTILLGFLGGQIFHVAIQKYDLSIDQLSYYVTMYNFAVVGTIAIFYQKGIPQLINQIYLVLTSVIVAWQLSYFNDWMAWALLVMLALYDLFAVLTPCGPLKALVKLMSKDDAPAMPGLLYEATLPENATRPTPTGQSSSRRLGRDNSNNVSRRRSSVASATNQRSERRRGEENEATSSRPASVAENVVATFREGNNIDTVTRVVAETPQQQQLQQQQQQQTLAVKSNSDSQEVVKIARRATSMLANMTSDEEATSTRTSMSSSSHSLPTASIPLAIAKVYKLPLVVSRSTMALHTTIATLDTSSPTSYLQQQFSPQELQMNVEVMFPRGGGRIESNFNDNNDDEVEEVRYVVYNKDGEVRRTLVVDAESGKVMEVVKRPSSKSMGSNNIKLGLGDFIFYSVLVSKAAENSFAAFVACFVSILMGLGMTLVLLAVYHKALPALPISIFLAVVIFVLTIYCMSPWIEALWQAGPFYV